jgi:hypothetical protein
VLQVASSTYCAASPMPPTPLARTTYSPRHNTLWRGPVEPGQFTSIRYGERLAEIGAVPSIGTVSDSFDNALAETADGNYTAELIRGPACSGPGKTVEDVELAML